MKTWEMIKELTENPEKKFQRVGDKLEVSVDIDDSLLWKSGYSPFNINHEWEEVKKPVDFMELLARVKGNGDFSEIDYKWGGTIYKGLNFYSTLEKIIDDAMDDNDLVIRLTQGKWYIE